MRRLWRYDLGSEKITGHTPQGLHSMRAA